MKIRRAIRLGFIFSRFRNIYTAMDKNMVARGDFSRVIVFTIRPKKKYKKKRILNFFFLYDELNNRAPIIPKGINNERNQ